jgi:hypothetical protein
VVTPKADRLPLQWPRSILAAFPVAPQLETHLRVRIRADVAGADVVCVLTGGDAVLLLRRQGARDGTD